MPFPANWLEELVAEWLELEGFTISTSVFVPAARGGRWSPDVVGAKLGTDGRLLIRHCEATMWLTHGPKNVTERFTKKFSKLIEDAVRTHFALIFGPDFATREKAHYEKWVVTCNRPSDEVIEALHVAGADQHLKLEGFVLTKVLPAIKQWKHRPTGKTKTRELPADKWLLELIDHFEHWGLVRPADNLPTDKSHQAPRGRLKNKAAARSDPRGRGCALRGVPRSMLAPGVLCATRFPSPDRGRSRQPPR